MDIRSSSFLRHEYYDGSYSTQHALQEFPPGRIHEKHSCPLGGAAKLVILRRTTRTAWRNDSLSGSSLAFRAASCIKPRMAKCAINGNRHMLPLPHCKAIIEQRTVVPVYAVAFFFSLPLNAHRSRLHEKHFLPGQDQQW